METPPPDSPYLSNHYDIFISHCGDDSKAKVALPLRARLMQCNLTAFVDEMDLPVGGDAEHNMQQALKLCKVAVVIFSGKFWSSASCLEELTQIVELAEDQTILYVPVFMFKTVADVRTAAHDWQGIDFAKKVCKPTGIRLKGEIINGKYPSVELTIDHICRELCCILRVPIPVAIAVQDPAITHELVCAHVDGIPPMPHVVQSAQQLTCAQNIRGYSSTHPPTDNGSKASVLLAGFLGQVVQHLISLLGKLVQLLMGRRLAGKRIAEASAATPGQGTLPRSLQPATRRPNSEFQSAGDGENLTDVAPQGRDPGVDTSTRPLPRMGSLQIVWSAAAADQPAGLTQISIYLEGDMPAAEIKLLVLGWLHQQEACCGARWHRAAVTVRQVASAVLHVLFYMPEIALRDLEGTLPQLLALGEGSTYYNLPLLKVEEELHNFLGLSALKDSLHMQGLAPMNWRLSTDLLGKRIDVELSTGSEGGLAIRRINPTSTPIITEISLWSAAHWAEQWLVIHGNEATQRAELQACPVAGEDPFAEPEPLQLVPSKCLESEEQLRTLAKRLYTGVFLMPQLARKGAFRVEALLDSILLQYPGVPLDLLDILQHPWETGATLEPKEQQAVQALPGVSEWQAAATALPAPGTCNWDVYISHNRADKHFACALCVLLERTGWGVHVFLDEERLQPGPGNRAMKAARESAAVAVLLFSDEYFEREATMRELRALWLRHAQRRVVLLPVFLRISVRDCKRRMEQENMDLPTGIRHLGELSILQPGLPKMRRETLWHVAHALSILLHKDFEAGVASYAASEESILRTGQ